MSRASGIVTHEDVKPDAMTKVDSNVTTGSAEEPSSNGEQKNVIKRTQMGFALKEEDVALPVGSNAEGPPSNTETNTKSPRLTALVVGKGPVKIYPGLTDMEDMGSSWCCGMEYQYRSMCKQHECGIYKNFHDALVMSNAKAVTPPVIKNPESGQDAAESETVSVDPSSAAINIRTNDEVVDEALASKVVSGAKKVEMELADSAVKSKIQKVKCRQLNPEMSCVDSSGVSGDVGSMKSGGEKAPKTPQDRKIGVFDSNSPAKNSPVRVRKGNIERCGFGGDRSPCQRSPEPDVIMMSPVSVSGSATSEDVLLVDDVARSPTSPLPVGKPNVRQLRSEKAGRTVKNDLNWEHDMILESPASRPLKPPDFFFSY